MKGVKLWIGLFLLLGVVAGAGADSFSILPSEDACATYLDLGDVPYLWFGNYSGAETSNFLKFTLPLQAGAVINSATLTLWGGEDGGYTGTATLYEVADNSWTEMGFPENPVPAFGPAIATFTYPGNWGAGVTLDVQAYLQRVVDNGTTVSFGAAAPFDENGTNFRICAREYRPYWAPEYQGYCPKLVVNYSPPPAATPIISPNGGSFIDPQSVTITCATDNATIRYTTDGTDPTDTSPIFSDNLTVSKTGIVKARATKTGYGPSAIAKAEFSFPVIGTQILSVAEVDTSVSYINLNSHVMFMGNWATSDAKSFIRFNLPELAGLSGVTVHSALFRWCGGDEGGEPGNNAPPATLYRVADNGWSETTMTLADCPAFGSVIETFDFPGYEMPIDFEVTSYLQAAVDSGSGQISLGAWAPNTFSEGHINRFRMCAREWPTATKRPVLIVDYTRTYSSADLAAVLAAMDTANTTVDKDGDGEITSSDLAIVLANLQ